MVQNVSSDAQQETLKKLYAPAIHENDTQLLLFANDTWETFFTKLSPYWKPLLPAKK